MQVKYFIKISLIGMLVVFMVFAGCSAKETTVAGTVPKDGTEAANIKETEEEDMGQSKTNGEKPRVEITMEDGGVIVLELDPDVAPATTANFLKLVNENFYDGLTFHRVIKGFMIQGGDPLGTGMGGSDETIVGEFASNGLKNSISHERGVISMARSNNKNSASSQFFITNDDATFLDGDYAAFGYVVSGMDVIDRISGVKTDANDKPLESVVIKTIRQIAPE